MSRYILRRLILLVPTLALVTLLVFSIIRLLPGDIVTLMMSEQGYASDKAKLEQMLGLDQPFHRQYVTYVGRVLQGDLGVSFWTKEPVLDEILRLALSASVMRMTRSMVLEVLREDYVRTAWAKGLPESLVIARHVLKNAMIPVVTVMGLQLSALLGGTVIMESIFVIPGMGKFLLDAITWRDYPVIQGINLFLATGVIVLNLVIDVVYGFLDPRIRFG